MKPSDARWLRPSTLVPDQWFSNSWHSGPYLTIGDPVEGANPPRNKISFTSEGERIWWLEDFSGDGGYYLLNINQTKLLCTHRLNGIRISWFDSTLVTRAEDWCKWNIEVSAEDPSIFQIKSNVFVQEEIAIGYVYFDETGIYFDYEQRSRNYPLHSIEQGQTLWTWRKIDESQRNYDVIEDQCVIGESGLPTFLEDYDDYNDDDVMTRGAAGHKKKKKTYLRSSDRFMTCSNNWFLFNGKCYKLLSKILMTKNQAKKVCGFYQSEIFLPQNRAEQRFLWRLNRAQGRRRSFYWLGITRDDNDVMIRDKDKREAGFNKWIKSRSSFSQDKCAVWKRSWYRANCNAIYNTICSKSAVQKIEGSCGKIVVSGADDVMVSASKQKDAEGRIVNGNAAEFGQFPWQVGIRFKEPMMIKGEEVFHNCGGSLIDQCWVVSAAHCFQGSVKEEFEIVIGDSNNEVDEGTEQRFEIDQLIIHENYESIPSPVNDIALIKLRRKSGSCVELGDVAQPICLPDENFLEKNGDLCQVSGWGQTNSSLGQSSAADNLMWTTLPIMKDKYCASRYNTKRVSYFNQEAMFCAGLKQGGRDSCVGDSGGPYACRNSNGRYVLTGIVSFGRGCARRKYPGVYTRVRTYVPWILTKIKQFGDAVVINN